jgi:tRNA pseudouridine synthase 10
MAKRKFDPSFYSSLKIDYSVGKQEELIHNIYLSLQKIWDGVDFESFQIGISWPVGEEYAIEFKYGVRDRIIEMISSEFDKKHVSAGEDAYFLVDFNKNSIFLRLKPLFIGGNYCKFSRELAQTEHFCRFCMGKGCGECHQTGHTLENSVEQILSKIICPFVESTQLVMHGAGREDGNVLMLGKGRPFVLELVCAKKRKIDLKKLEKLVNSSTDLISINSLEIVDEAQVAIVKNSVHEKKYLAFVACEEKINFEKLKNLINKKIEVDQQTPLRVSKRRVDMLRKKEITVLGIKKIDEKNFELKILTSHGTYVKEFISGDEERTNPSLFSLIENKCECKQLDVIEII